ncbi:DUF2313 domain-containing protein [Paraburkholderia sediminicola]|uniref:DUF2313 domain-containing protein n=1 Tax=Paraburkholderia rhynchosiae TaxID=487049 RepID=A0ACC7NMS8_9BURK
MPRLQRFRCRSASQRNSAQRIAGHEGGCPRRGRLLHADEDQLFDGYTITITQFAPARVGQCRCGQPLCGLPWAFAWQINAPLNTIVQSRVGISRAGEALASFGNAVLQCELTEIIPAHTIPIFAYSSEATCFESMIRLQQSRSQRREPLELRDIGLKGTREQVRQRRWNALHGSTWSRKNCAQSRWQPGLRRVRRRRTRY